MLSKLVDTASVVCSLVDVSPRLVVVGVLDVLVVSSVVGLPSCVLFTVLDCAIVVASASVVSVVNSVVLPADVVQSCGAERGHLLNANTRGDKLLT